MIAGETITVITDSPDDVDEYGDPIDPAATARVVVENVLVAPRRSTDTDQIGRGGIVVGCTLFRTPAFSISRDSRVECRGELWEVEGEPGQWVSPTGRTGTEVDIRKATG